MRSRRPRRLALLCTLALLMLGGLTSPLRAVAAPTGPESWDCGSKTLGLDKNVVQLAPVVPTERTPQGGTISPVALNGRWMPVIVLHGWTGRATHPNTDGTDKTLGEFSHLVDLRVNRLQPDPGPESLIGQLQALPGAAVFTFDYHPYSGRWVTDPHLGPGLGKVIDCLSKASGQKVIIVGHSMGGLIARYAATTPDRSSAIRAIVTFGTPSTGSLFASLGMQTLDVAAADPASIFAIIRLLLAYCGQVSTENLDTVCFGLSDQAKAFDSEAGRALRTGSKELAALKPYPSSIDVQALAGQMTMRVPLGWFQLVGSKPEVALGDLAVTADSAVAGADSDVVLQCTYRLRLGFGEGGQEKKFGLYVGFQGTSKSLDVPVREMLTPCYHGSLMRGIDLTGKLRTTAAQAVAGSLANVAPAPETTTTTPVPTEPPPVEEEPEPTLPEGVEGPTCRQFAEMAPRTGLDSDLTADQIAVIKALLERNGLSTGKALTTITSIRIIAYCNIYGGRSGNNMDDPIDYALDW